MTRGGIKLIKDGIEDKYFYSHCDGYPKGVLIDLLHIHSSHKQDYNRLLSKLHENYEIVNKFPGDIEYAYVIDFDNRIIKTYAGNTDKYSSDLVRVDSFDSTENELEIY